MPFVIIAGFFLVVALVFVVGYARADEQARQDRDRL